MSLVPGGAHRHVRAGSGFPRAALWTVIGTAVPGSGLLAAGRRRLGTFVLLVALALAGAVGWLATAGRPMAIGWALEPDTLLLIAVAVLVVGLMWVGVVVATYRALLPHRATRGQRLTGTALVVALSLAVMAPAVAAADLARAQRSLVQNVFADGDREAAPVAETPEPFGGVSRLNVLLLGGDGGAGREGVRTDTVIVASIDVASGATTLFSLPRNLEELPFPPGSPLATVYPDGFDAGSEDESLLNAVYRNGPADNPTVYADAPDPGARFLMDGVGYALGLHLDYYVLVNLDGFSELVDALGGVTVNVNYYVPVGGEPTTGRLPDSYIAPGPSQRLDGPTALAFARGRFGLSDYDRMDRQRCVVQAMVDAADPLSLVTRYGRLAGTAEDIISTDLPQSRLRDVVELATRAQGAGFRSVVFDDTVIRSADPDYDLIRSLVQQALALPAAPATPVAPSSPQAAPAVPSSAPSDSPSDVPSDAPSGLPSQEATAAPIDDVTDACAYDPVRAQEALDEGEPPTYGDG